MSTMNLQDAMKNPARLFGTPESLESSTELTAGGVNADCLRRVVDALPRINREST